MPLKLGIAQVAIPRRYGDTESFAVLLRIALFFAVDANLDRVVAGFRVVNHGASP